MTVDEAGLRKLIDEVYDQGDWIRNKTCDETRDWGVSYNTWADLLPAVRDPSDRDPPSQLLRAVLDQGYWLRSGSGDPTEDWCIPAALYSRIAAALGTEDVQSP